MNWLTILHAVNRFVALTLLVISALVPVVLSLSLFQLTVVLPAIMVTLLTLSAFVEQEIIAHMATPSKKAEKCKLLNTFLAAH